MNRTARARVTAYVGLGSNLHDPRAQVLRAIEALGTLPESDVLRCSPLYCSRALGVSAQPDYVNAVCGVDTSLGPRQLLQRLHRIEDAQGRVRRERWGARTLDLDLLIYGDRRIAQPDLGVPHPCLTKREFVLRPLADLAPQLEVPDSGLTVAELLARCPPQGVCRLETTA